MTPDEYCQQKAAQSGSSFYYSFMFLPPPRRRAIIALYAFCREVDDIVDEVTDPGVARTKLAWWRAEIARVYADTPADNPADTPQHPVACALQSVVRDFNLPQAHLLTIIDGMEMDLNQNRYLDFVALELYCHRVAGVVGLLSAEIFGYTDARTLTYARELGIALQLTNVIRDVGEDARRGRIYLPQDEMQRFGVTDAGLLHREYGEPFRALMALQTQRALQRYALALEALPAIDRKAQRAGLAMAAIYRALLQEIERDGFKVLDRRTSLTPVRKLWLAWKTVRGT